MESIQGQLPYGKYAPSRVTAIYLLITKLGLGRGRVSRWMRKQWIKKHGPTVDINLKGIKYRLDIKHNTTDGKILTSSKVYDDLELNEITACAKEAKSSPVFVDVGANTGYYSLTLSSTFSKIIAIEPNPPTLAMLTYNVALNQLEDKIKVVPCCVGEGGSVPFYCSGGLGSASLLQDSAGTKPIMVDSLPLYEVIIKSGIEHIDALKIDIEGYEDKALLPFFQAAPKSLWPKLIVIENCNRSVWTTDIINHMQKNGYREVKETRGNSILKLNPT